MKKPALLAITFVLIVAATIVLADNIQATQPQKFDFGVTFSPDYAQNLGLDWKQTYLKTLDELKVKNLRIPSYWKNIEPAEGKFDFSEDDFMVSEAEKRGAKLIMVVGMKQPRWPECQPPNWAYDLSLEDRKNKTLELVKTVVEKYKTSPAIWAWQVENEPLFKFGTHCDPPDKYFLKAEVDLVKSLDPQKPVILTDSGEWRPWVEPMQLSDYFGTTMYRSSYNEFLNLYVKLPFPPQFYILKSNLVRKYFAPKNLETINIELQAEPWSATSLYQTPLDTQTNLFSLQDFKDNVEFAKETEFAKIYLWGVEWWFYMAGQGHPEYLNYAKTLFF